MMKRELDKIADASVDVDAPRTKRRRDGTTQDESEGTSVETPGDKPSDSDLIKVKEEGTKLWTTIREAVNKDGRTLSNDFVRLPSKRQYADYYQQTKHPVCLEDVKTRLDSGLYRSLETVKLDLEICFRNAKRYNMKESQIWKDAKHLHKLVNREYARMTGTMEDARVDVENDDDNAVAPVGSDDEGGKKRKAPNLIRVLKARLQKLVDKTDDSGRVLSSEFMDLPNKKQWPVYYKAIKKPQCLENIFKRLKRKEYHTPVDFCKDVELVFSNAMEFNAENSQIYEDARILREYFHQSMADLPPPYNLPEYSSHPSSSKIMLKVPAASVSHPSVSEAPVASTHTTTTGSAVKPSVSVLLRVPGLHTDNHPPPQAQTTTVNVSSPVVSTPKLAPVAIPRTSSTTYATTTHYPNAVYQQPVEPPAPASGLHITSPLPPTNLGDLSSQVNNFSHKLSKSPVPSPTRTFRCMVLITKPQERQLELDHTEGVRIWAMRLGKNETSLCIRGIQFIVDEEEEGDTEMDKEEEEEEEEEVPEVKKGRGRKKGKGKAASRVVKVSSRKQKSNPIQDEEISVRINGSVIQGKPEPLGEWDVDIPWGPNVLEVSEKGGAAWKVYIDRGA